MCDALRNLTACLGLMQIYPQVPQLPHNLCWKTSTASCVALPLIL